MERKSGLIKTDTRDIAAQYPAEQWTKPPPLVLDPGRGKTKTGYLWAVLRDDRGWGGALPPGVVFHYRPGRGGEHAEDIRSGFEGTWTLTAAITACPNRSEPGASR